MGKKHRLERLQRRTNPFSRRFDPRHETFGHPFHYGLPDGFLVREMTKQRTLGQVHVLGNCGCRDFGGVRRGSKFDNCFDRDVAPFVCRKFPWLRACVHGFISNCQAAKVSHPMARTIDNSPRMTKIGDASLDLLVNMMDLLWLLLGELPLHVSAWLVFR